MSSSRHLRPDSPTGRRFENPGRSSTGTLYKAYDTPSNYTTRETFTSPRSSGDRVVPISKETYVNGQLVESSRNRSTYDSGYNDRHHHRRSTYDTDSRAPISASSSLRPSVVNHDRDISPADRSAARGEDRYVSSASAPRSKEHRKLYSVDDGRATRIPGEKELRRRDDRIDNKEKLPPSDRSRAYHLRGSSKSSEIDDYGAYEYTDARGMYRDTEPKWRARRGSIDTATRERPTSMVEPYQTGPRTSNRDLGPPVSTRGFDRVNNNNVGISRHGSLQNPYQRSPSRSRGYTTSSAAVGGYSSDENYHVPPRVARARDDSSYYSSERGSELMSPTRIPDEYYEPRRSKKWEDREVASRGFGIRAPSVDARSSRESDVGRYDDDHAPPLMIEAAPPSELPRRDYPSEPREATRETRLREPDWREPDRIRDKERNLSRDSRNSPPPKDKDAPRERDRDYLREREYLPKERAREPEELRRERDVDYRERDYPPKEKGRDPEDLRLERDAEYRERDQNRYGEGDRRLRERRPDRDTHDDARRDRDRRPARDELDHAPDDQHDHHRAAEAVAGTAAVGAAAYGAKELYDRRGNDHGRDSRDTRAVTDERDVDRDRRVPVDSKELRATQSGLREPDAEGKMRDDRENVVGRRYKDEDMDEDDRDAPRRRNYVSKKQEIDSIERREDDTSSKHSEILDPEEDYRRRVQQAQQEMGRTPARKEDNDDDSDRERRRRERDVNRDSTRDSERSSENPRASESTLASSDGQALTRYSTRDNELTESPPSDEHSEASDDRRKKRVSIVDPPKETKQPKSILRKPTSKFPEDPNPIREGVAPLKDAKATGDKSIPPTARWTKINRANVNPEALEEKGERFEERQDHVIVLRVLSREEVQKFADRTKEIRDIRYAERKEREKKEQQTKADDRDFDKTREHEHERDSERTDKDDSKTSNRYKPDGY